MKTFLLAAGLTAVTGTAFASIPLGRGELSASIAATATYDTNVFGAEEGIADWSGLLIPRLAYSRKAGLIEADANAGISFIRYLEETQLDAENIDATVTLQTTETDIRNYAALLSAVYRESSELNTDLNTRLNTTSTILTARGSLITGARSSAAATGSFADNRYEGQGEQQLLNTQAFYDYKDFFYGNSLRLLASYDEFQSSGNNELGVPLNQNSYAISAGLGRPLYHDRLRGGISYGYRVLNRSADETDEGQRQRSGYLIGATLEGPFLPERYFPKVTSEFSVSYQDAATPGIQDTGTKVLTGHLGLAWQARQNTRATFTLNRIQRISVDDLTVVTTSVLFGLEQNLRANLSATLNAGYDWSTYETIDRDDRIATCSAALRYRFARAWDAHLGSTYTSTSSSLPGASYDRVVTSLSVTRGF